MTTGPTFLWHDYETFGADPRRDRPCQFGAVRTDCDLEIVGDPMCWYAKPADDYLPTPEACLITGITPQMALAEGMPEAMFMKKILDQMQASDTCSVGYNSVAFDDEITRFSAWRNLFEPYAREYKNGNSRFDLINVLRMARALRPEGINWPLNAEGRPSFKLTDLTRTNGIDHGEAHDAMGDVLATLEMARLLRNSQRKLFDWTLKLRDKRFVQTQLQPYFNSAVLHFAGEYGWSRDYTALLVPLAAHPQQNGTTICFDLASEPDILLTESCERLRELMYQPERLLAEGARRPGLVLLKSNKLPIIAPVGVLKGLPEERVNKLLPQLDTMRRRMKVLRANQAELTPKVLEFFNLDRSTSDAAQIEPEASLYGGAFLSPADRQRADEYRKALSAAYIRAIATPESRTVELPTFEDGRMKTLCSHFKARNFPGLLTQGERASWEEFRLGRLRHGAAGGSLRQEEFFGRLQRLRDEHRGSEDTIEILDELRAYGEALCNAAADEATA